MSDGDNEQDTRTARELIAAAGESVRGHSYGLDTLLVIAEEEGWSADRVQRLLAGCERLRGARARIAELEAELAVVRESNARLNRRAQEAEAKAARVEKIERRIAELEAERDHDISAMTIRGLRERLDEARARIEELEAEAELVRKQGDGNGSHS